MTVYTYSITFKDHPLRLDDLRGVGASPGPLRTVTAGPLTAVVSDVSEELRPKRRDIGAHQDVQQRLMEDGAVLPLRFGYTAPDDDAVRLALEERADDYSERLRQLDGCVEYNLKASQAEDMVLRQILSESPEARQLNDDIRDGRADPEAALRLGELVAQEVQARQEALASGVIEALRAFAREIDPGDPSGEDFLSVSFLVASDQEELFLATELSLAHQMGEGFDFRLHGPLPPYSFT
ncbi:GvpL/GvpF family gas vesicle protein [Streptomyces sp. NPDC005529]|uniref:GvpL/GvpF family gas vesicle protein n=1 Tax=unclassified Streptomyces TaxID=2593676 RepID=UPI0033B8A568